MKRIRIEINFEKVLKRLCKQDEITNLEEIKELLNKTIDK